MPSRRLVPMSFALLVVFAVPALAQRDTATALGTVTDAQGGVLPGATVMAMNTATGVVRSVVADAEGAYRMAALPPGTYDFRAEVSGFSPAIRGGLVLALGAEAVIDFQLALSSVIEAVTVTAQVPVVQTTTSALDTRLDREAIDLLPLIGRDYESLLRIAPGAQNSNGVSFMGSRGRSNQWNVDGLDNSEDISGYSRQSLALDSVQEVQVLVTGFKAEYGQASGGVVNVVTRSGTNDLHGSAFYLFRNQDLMSRSPYADRSLPADPFQRVHYGGWLGGPVKRNRAHFFLNYEREDRDTNTASTRVLPASTAAFAPSTLQFLAANNIPLSIFGAGGTVRHVRPEFVDIHNVTAKLDTQLTNSQSFTARYQLTHDRQPSGQSGTLFDFNGATSFFRTNYVNGNHKWILGPDLVNEAYVQVGQSFGDWTVARPGLVNLTITGGFNLGGTSDYPQRRTDWVYQAIDNLTWSRFGTRTGDHAVKAGVQFKLFDSEGFFDSNFRGTYTFPTLASFVAGTPSRFTRRTGDSNLARPNRIYGLYLQDDWRPTPSLTLNLGLRYDYEAAKTEALVDVTGRAGNGVSKDRNNVAPRFGFAWAPGGSTSQVFYGGTGIYYDQVILNVVGNARFTPPKVIGLQIDNPRWPDPFAGGTTTIPPPDLSVIDENLRTPWNWNTQLGLRREITRNIGLDVSVVHNRGYDQVFILNTNAGRPGTANINGVGAVRPDPTVTNRSFYSNFGEIRYTGLVVDVRKRMTSRLSYGANYVLSKTRDNAFNFVSGFLVPENQGLNWGPNTDDRRHVANTHLEYRLPANLMLGLIGEFETEAPMNVTVARDVNGDGLTTDWVHESICRNIACPGFTYSRNSVRELSLEEANRLRALFGFAPVTRFDDNPKYFNADLTLQWTPSLGASRTLKLTVEAFNVFNLAQRNLPTESISSGTFGQIVSVRQPRAIQLTAQVGF
jgi:outer membrane receptor protein involved in Fe transport